MANNYRTLTKRQNFSEYPGSPLSAGVGPNLLLPDLSAINFAQKDMPGCRAGFRVKCNGNIALSSPNKTSGGFTDSYVGRLQSLNASPGFPIFVMAIGGDDNGKLFEVTDHGWKRCNSKALRIVAWRDFELGSTVALTADYILDLADHEDDMVSVATPQTRVRESAWLATFTSAAPNGVGDGFAVRPHHKHVRLLASAAGASGLITRWVNVFNALAGTGSGWWPAGQIEITDGVLQVFDEDIIVSGSYDNSQHGNPMRLYYQAPAGQTVDCWVTAEF